MPIGRIKCSCPPNEVYKRLLISIWSSQINSTRKIAVCADIQILVLSEEKCYRIKMFSIKLDHFNKTTSFLL